MMVDWMVLKSSHLWSSEWWRMSFMVNGQWSMVRSQWQVTRRLWIWLLILIGLWYCSHKLRDPLQTHTVAVRTLPLTPSFPHWLHPAETHQEGDEHSRIDGCGAVPTPGGQETVGVEQYRQLRDLPTQERRIQDIKTRWHWPGWVSIKYFQFKYSD